ncbi:hypothetical protein ABW21_db0200604 [Orbilia brochopaga]|nr:hypothetical protein ABW21_db0200604 [Drechslerella brochopaga]
MLRLSSSQILLTNRDTTRSLVPSRRNKKGTSLQVKSKPTRASARLAARAAAIASSTAAAIANASQPSTAATPDPYFNQGDRLTPAPTSPSVLAPADQQDLIDPGLIDWSGTSGSNPEPTAAAIALEAAANILDAAVATDVLEAGPSNVSGTDGADDLHPTGFEEFANLRQVVSLRDVDSFPNLPIETEGTFDIWEDPEDEVEEEWPPRPPTEISIEEPVIDRWWPETETESDPESDPDSDMNDVLGDGDHDQPGSGYIEESPLAIRVGMDQIRADLLRVVNEMPQLPAGGALPARLQQAADVLRLPGALDSVYQDYGSLLSYALPHLYLNYREIRNDANRPRVTVDGLAPYAQAQAQARAPVAQFWAELRSIANELQNPVDGASTAATQLEPVGDPQGHAHGQQAQHDAWILNSTQPAVPPLLSIPPPWLEYPINRRVDEPHHDDGGGATTTSWEGMPDILIDTQRGISYVLAETVIDQNTDAGFTYFDEAN